MFTPQQALKSLQNHSGRGWYHKKLLMHLQKYSQIKYSIKRYVISITRYIYYSCHIYKIKPTMGDWKSSYRENRREEVILIRLRIGTCRDVFQHHFRVENLASMNKCISCGDKF